MIDPIVAKFDAAFTRIREKGTLVQTSKTVYGADVWELNGWKAFLTDGGYGQAINGPTFRAYNSFGSGTEQIIFVTGSEEDLDANFG